MQLLENQIDLCVQLWRAHKNQFEINNFQLAINQRTIVEKWSACTIFIVIASKHSRQMRNDNRLSTQTHTHTHI
jgi:hypothetical protein